MDFRLLPLKKEFIDLVYAIEKRCFTMPWSKEAFLDVLKSSILQALMMLNSANDVLGYVIFCEVADELQILNIAVDPDRQQKGLAAFMMTHIHSLALKHGRKYSFLEVRESNKPALALYQKFGYKPYMRRPNYYSDTSEDAILMRVSLKRKS